MHLCLSLRINIQIEFKPTTMCMDQLHKKGIVYWVGAKVVKNEHVPDTRGQWHIVSLSSLVAYKHKTKPLYSRS